MRFRNISAAVALGVAALGLSACATSLSTRVTRYQAMPAPQGQTFIVVPDGGLAHNGGLEFQRPLDGIENRTSARVHGPEVDRVRWPVAEKGIMVAPQYLLDRRRHLAGKNHVEAMVANIPSHQVAPLIRDHAMKAVECKAGRFGGECEAAVL